MKRMRNAAIYTEEMGNAGGMIALWWTGAFWYAEVYINNVSRCTVYHDGRKQTLTHAEQQMRKGLEDCQ